MTHLNTLTTKEIVALHNRIPGNGAVTRFENRTVAIRRTEMALTLAGLSYEGGELVAVPTASVPGDDEPMETVEHTCPNDATTYGAEPAEGADVILAAPIAQLRQRALTVKDQLLEACKAADAELKRYELHFGTRSDVREQLFTAIKRAEAKAAEALGAEGSVGRHDTAIALLQRPEGATITQLVEATGWAKPTAQTFLGRVLPRHGLRAMSEKPGKDETRVYRAVAA